MRAAAGDEKTITALAEARPVTFHLNATPGVSEDLLRRAYRNDLSPADLRAELEKRTDEGVVLTALSSRRVTRFRSWNGSRRALLP